MSPEVLAVSFIRRRLDICYPSDYFLVASYNQPKLCPTAAWDPNAITIADRSFVGGKARGIFVDSENSVYFADHFSHRISIWSHCTSNPRCIYTDDLFEQSPIFVTQNKDIYVSNGNDPGRVDRLTNGGTSSQQVARFNGTCYGLFVDLNNTLYCAVAYQHQVATVSLTVPSNSSTKVAGNGVAGMNSNQLNQPWDIFVNSNFDLYVVDAGNGRIQRFRPGEVNASTVAGDGIPNGLSLSFPTDVILDADANLYIVDNNHHRILRVNSNGYQCIAACNGSDGYGSSQLNRPYFMRFDKEANIYVTDEFNNRIQKFLFLTNSCGE